VRQGATAVMSEVRTIALPGDGIDLVSPAMEGFDEMARPLPGRLSEQRFVPNPLSSGGSDSRLST
jgi:hypothetical protein